MNWKKIPKVYVVAVFGTIGPLLSLFFTFNIMERMECSTDFGMPPCTFGGIPVNPYYVSSLAITSYFLSLYTFPAGVFVLLVLLGIDLSRWMLLRRESKKIDV